MPFKKGESGNPKGRKIGSENKDKKKLRESLTLLVNDNYGKFKRELNKLQGKDFLDRFINILEYTTPKLNRTDLTNDGDKFDFSVLNDAELINELERITKLIEETKSTGK